MQAVACALVLPSASRTVAQRSRVQAARGLSWRCPTLVLSQPSRAHSARRGMRVNAVQFIKDLMGSSQRKADAAERSDLAAPAPGITLPAGKALATFAGGCFWVRTACGGSRVVARAWRLVLLR